MEDQSFSIAEAKRLVHGQAVEVKVAQEYVPAVIQGHPKVTPTAVYLDVLTKEKFIIKVHYTFIRKPQEPR